ncbi:MAG: hypothetical protein IH591_13610 [Bacteroidales bacterium]|nr:hypothetical protein [Bacteroidales bacterium]
MSDPLCPNITGCKLVNDPTFAITPESRNFYLRHYCKGIDGSFDNCQRYITKTQIFFCPDFVLPDSEMSIDEILDRIENSNQN